MFCLGFGFSFSNDGKGVVSTILNFFVSVVLCPFILGGMIYEYLHNNIGQ
jgi:hypothetical protein